MNGVLWYKILDVCFYVILLLSYILIYKCEYQNLKKRLAYRLSINMIRKNFEIERKQYKWYENNIFPQAQVLWPDIHHKTGINFFFLLTINLNVSKPSDTFVCFLNCQRSSKNCYFKSVGEFLSFPFNFLTIIPVVLVFLLSKSKEN